jgi:hypothetical protein
MTLIEPMAATHDPDFALQLRHRTAADMHEKAVRHHRQAALLHDRGDKDQAQTHANIARRHAISALAACDGSPIFS